MEFESPVRGQDGYIIIKMEVSNNLAVQYTTSDKIPTPDKSLELYVYVGIIAEKFEEFSVKWFTAPIFSTHFLKSIEHQWVYELEHPKYSDSITKFTVRQTWSPTHIKVVRAKYIIYWNLTAVEYIPVSGFDTNVIVDNFSNSTPLLPSSGPIDDSVHIPYAEDLTVATIVKSTRARAKERIRRARIRATMLKWKLNDLLDSYYTKYGTIEGVDKDSELSSEIDSNSESNSKK
jgi:hypothetical protein